MKRLADRHPNLVRPITLRHETFEGRKVEGIEITRNPRARDGKPVFLQLGVHHAREWPSGEHAMEWAYELLRGYRAGNRRAVRLVNTTRTIIVPIVNPDGFNLSREAGQLQGGGNGRDADSYEETLTQLVAFGQEYWRKNCRFPTDANDGSCMQPGNGVEHPGVDPNRNYGGFWGGPGASDIPVEADYRGPGPFSEPETRNIRGLISHRQVTGLITNTRSRTWCSGRRARPVSPTRPTSRSTGSSAGRWRPRTGTRASRRSSSTTPRAASRTGATSPRAGSPTRSRSVAGPVSRAPTSATTATSTGRFGRWLPSTAAPRGSRGRAVATVRRTSSRRKARRTRTATRSSRGRPRATPSCGPEDLPDRDLEGRAGVLPGPPRNRDRRTEVGPVPVASTPRPGRWRHRERGRPATGDPSPPLEFSGSPAGPPADGAQPCGDFETTDPSCWNDHPFTVPRGQGIDNARATVEVDWQSPLSDWDMKVFVDSDGDGSSVGETEEVGQSAEGAPTTAEEVSFAEPVLEPGQDYVVRVINFAAVEPYDGTVTYEGPEEFQPGRREAWTLTCERGGEAVSSRQVFVERGDVARVNLARACKRRGGGGPGPGERPCPETDTTIVGDGSDEVVRGTDGADVIVVRGGDDVVRAGTAPTRSAPVAATTPCGAARARIASSGRTGATTFTAGAPATFSAGATRATTSGVERATTISSARRATTRSAVAPAATA